MHLYVYQHKHACIKKSQSAAKNQRLWRIAVSDRLDPERMAFLRDAFAEMLENTTDVFATAISRLALPEDCEANISLKERALAAITGAATFSSYAHATHTNLNLG